jgi:hypothetical protein
LLTEALEELPERDRTAIVLRFFESRSMEEVGRTLGSTESAAKMRLARAVEKLRRIVRKRGVVLPTATVLAALSAHATQAAPAGLASAVATSALLHQSSAETIILAKGILKVMAQNKAKKLAIAGRGAAAGRRHRRPRAKDGVPRIRFRHGGAGKDRTAEGNGRACPRCDQRGGPCARVQKRSLVEQESRF